MTDLKDLPRGDWHDDQIMEWAKRFITRHRPSPATDPSLGGTIVDIAVDFDDTLAHSLWTPENRTRDIGEPIWNNIVKCHDLIARGYSIIIHTARGWEDEQAIIDWCAKIGLPIHYVVCAKPLAKMYVDDRALHESASSWFDVIVHKEEEDLVKQ